MTFQEKNRLWHELAGMMHSYRLGDSFDRLTAARIADRLLPESPSFNTTLGVISTTMRM